MLRTYKKAVECALYEFIITFRAQELTFYVASYIFIGFVEFVPGSI